MSLMSLGSLPCVFARKENAFDGVGGCFDEVGCGLPNMSLEMSLEAILMSSMSRRKLNKNAFRNRRVNSKTVKRVGIDRMSSSIDSTS